MTKRFLRWIERLFRTSKDTAKPFRCARVENLPAVFSEKTLYVLGDDECEWAAAMSCPCGCGSIIHLSLAPDSRPSWRVRRHRDGTVGLLPSVWRTVGCRSHFVLYKGRLFWCRSELDLSSNGQGDEAW
jgi:hypothetical protein